MTTPQRATGENGSDAAAASSPLRVLIVEDNPDDAELLLRELRGGGFAVESARVQTAAALEKALAAQTWDVVISDYFMPQFSALDALALLHRTGLDLPFIIVSGAIGEDTAVAAIKAGAHDYLMKGNLARLVPAIERELRDAAVRGEKRRAEEARWEEAQIAEALARVAGELISSLDTPIMLNRLCQLTTEVLDCERSHALVWRPEADAFMLTAGAGYTAEEWEAMRTQKFSRRILGDLLAQLERHDVVQASAPDRQRAAEGREAERQQGLYAALRRGPAVIGILAAQNMRPGCFTRRQERIALGVAQLASMALENALGRGAERSQPAEVGVHGHHIARAAHAAERDHQVHRPLDCCGVRSPDAQSDASHATARAQRAPCMA